MVDPDSYSQMKRIIERELVSRGFPAQDFVFSILIGHSDMATLRSDAQRYIDAGMNYLIVGLPRSPDDSVFKDLEAISRELAPSL
jgi:hypothetical protein